MIENILKAASWLVAIGLGIVTIVPANERPVTGIQHDLEHFSAFGLAGLFVRACLFPTFARFVFWRRHFRTGFGIEPNPFVSPPRQARGFCRRCGGSLPRNYSCACLPRIYEKSGTRNG